MAFQSRAVFSSVWVTKKLDGWQGKKKGNAQSSSMNQPWLNPAEAGEQRQVKPGFKEISQTPAFQNQKSHKNLYSFFPGVEKFATLVHNFALLPLCVVPQMGKAGSFVSIAERPSPPPSSFKGREGSKCTTHWVFPCPQPTPAPSKMWMWFFPAAGRFVCHPGCWLVPAARLLCFSYSVVTAKPRVYLPWGASVTL